MALEIEKKYLVVNEGYKSMARDIIEIKQGYLSRVPERTVRVRLWNNRGFITVKGKNSGAVRKEFEFEIPYSDALEMLELADGSVIEKTRYIVPYNGDTWEIDEFHGRREGLKLAEIEIPATDYKFDLPPFIGEDVTGNPEYYNSNL